MGRKFTEMERAEIITALKDICTEKLKRYGYKKISVDSLCKEAGISKGAFYLFYDSKEQLFYEVIIDLQNKIYHTSAAEIESLPGCGGIINALKKLYRIYDESKFFQQSSTEDYRLFLNKLNDEQRAALHSSERRNAEVFVKGQRLLQSEERVLSVIYALLMNVKNDALLPENHLDVFDFMVEQIIPTMYQRGVEE